MTQQDQEAAEPPVTYEIVQDKPLTGWRRVFRFAYFPYTVFRMYSPNAPYPFCDVVKVADTRWGARRAIRRDRRRRARPDFHRTIDRLSL